MQHVWPYTDSITKSLRSFVEYSSNSKQHVAGFWKYWLHIQTPYVTKFRSPCVANTRGKAGWEIASLAADLSVGTCVFKFLGNQSWIVNSENRSSVLCNEIVNIMCVHF